MKFISFGYNCSVTAYLKKIKAINIDSCFDNTITKKLNKLTSLIRNDTTNWFVDCSTKEKNKKWHVFCNRFETLSIHDAPINLEKKDAIKYIKNKKENQLGKIIKTIKEEKENLILIRSNEESTKVEEIFDFYETIKKIRTANFKLYVFQNKLNTNFSIENLKIFNIKLPSYNNKYWIYDKDWIFIFKSIFSKIL